MAPNRKQFVFTLNNYTESELHAISKLEDRVVYLCYGKEVGESGTPHLQGFVQWKEAVSFAACKKLLGTRVHLEGSRTVHAAIEYCHKDGMVVEYGKKPERKDHHSKHDLGGIIEAYKGGGVKRAREYDEVGWVLHGFKIQRTIQLKFEYRGEVKAVWLYGAPGCGKSRWAYETYPNAYRKAPQTKWWDYYLGEEEVVFDDMCTGGVSIANLLRWVDRYPCLVETKGGAMPLYGKIFVFTSNLTPRNVFPEVDQVHIDALHRRCQVLHMDEIGKYAK